MFSYSIWEWIAFFIIYCFIGWIFESLYVSWEHRQWVNRGFLHGPFLPIYGFGAVIILISTIPVRNSFPLIFLFGMVGATLLEYATGYVMEKIFHVKYWDYSCQPLNLNGYICLGCSLAWGGFSLLLTVILHNPVEHFVLAMPHVWLIVADIVFCVYFISDMITSAQEAFDLKKMILANEDVQRLQKRLDVVLAFVEDDKEKFLEYLKEKGEKLAESKEALELELREGIEAARTRYESQKVRLRAARIVRRNPSSTTVRHKFDFDELREYRKNMRKR
ncbi:MAG: hypothetical protein ACI4EK_06190 [Wujia sp.]